MAECTEWCLEDGPPFARKKALNIVTKVSLLDTNVLPTVPKDTRPSHVSQMVCQHDCCSHCHDTAVEPTFWLLVSILKARLEYPDYRRWPSCGESLLSESVFDRRWL